MQVNRVNSYSEAKERSIRSRIKTTEKDFVVLGSGLNSSQKKKLENAAAAFQFKVVTDWSPDVTHLVVSLASNVHKKEKLAVRSLKYLLALMGTFIIATYVWCLLSITFCSCISFRQ